MLFKFLTGKELGQLQTGLNEALKILPQEYQKQCRYIQIMKNIVPYLVALIIVACSGSEPPNSDMNSNGMAADSIQSNKNVSSNVDTVQVA